MIFLKYDNFSFESLLLFLSIYFLIFYIKFIIFLFGHLVEYFC